MLSFVGRPLAEESSERLKFLLEGRSRFAFREELPLGGSSYGSDCMVVCNDWHSALVPMLIHAEKTTAGRSDFDFSTHQAISQCLDPSHQLDSFLNVLVR